MCKTNHYTVNTSLSLVLNEVIFLMEIVQENRIFEQTSSKFMKKAFITSLLFIAITHLSLAQISFQKKKISLKTNTEYNINTENEITAFSINIADNQTLTNTKIITSDETFVLQRHDEFSETPTSQLVVFSKPTKSFKIISGGLEGEINIRMQYVKPLESKLPLRITADSCGKPAVIPATEWRKGLPNPKEAPVKSKVNFVIVHHSAGSNLATNYTEVVRNIYVFHTSPAPNGNGWNDVGYNFLIAQDGTIFEGRSGQGIMEGDDVVGAHFCGKNTGTMGICLLGNYMEIEPPKAAINSLVKLIGWKLSKENLQNIGQAQHSGGTLNIISGHRDGCSTDCPGDYTYKRLDEIRQLVGQSCTFKNRVTAVENSEIQSFKIYPNPSSEYLLLEMFSNNSANKLQIFDSKGIKKDVEIEFFNEKILQIDISNLNEGLHILKLNGKTMKFWVGR